MWHDSGQMLRWLGIVVALALVSAPADAQVFKPKAKKAAATKSEKAEKKTPAKAAKKAPAKKRVKKKSKARPADGAEAEADSTESDPDYVKIWDDDTIE